MAATAATILLSGSSPHRADAAEGPPRPPSENGLFILDPYSKNTGAACPLKRTDVRAEVSGYLSRVRVTQIYTNNSPNKIEAVYLFPLPPDSAVDEMTMRIGSRTIRAEIRKRDEARQIYEQARNQGHSAALLDQQRPNLFTQRVANIEPGATVNIEIAYVHTLKYEEGSYEFTFPATVGPRYNPPTVKDTAAISTKYAPPAVRAGHDLSIEVKLDAGVPLQKLSSTSHEIDVQRAGESNATVRLRDKAVIPNRDFTLRYAVAGERIEDAVLTHRDARGGFFTLILQPPRRVTVEDVTPKELIFVLDTSGSMSGFPIEKAKETMRLALAGLYARDTFNLITFAGDTHVLFPSPVPATPENLRQAQQFLASRSGRGGTEMMKAVRAAFAPTGETGAVRIICFMTDGYVGNEGEILAEIQRHPEARVFSFGIGSSVNRFLLDKMADEGRGEVEYVSLKDDGSAAAARFHERVRNPLLTDLSIDWGGLPIADVYPKRLPDLFSAKPVILHGRYTKPANGVIKLRGQMSGRAITREVAVRLPESETRHDTLATLWARQRIEDLSSRDYRGIQEMQARPEIRDEITNLGLNYRLMTPFTSFVAVDRSRTTEGGTPVTIEVPVEMPDGVSHEGVFGDAAVQMGAKHLNAVGPAGFGGGYAARAPMPPSMGRLPRQSANEVRFERADMPRTKLSDELKQVTSGRVRIEIWLTDATPEILARLAKLGFQEDGRPRVAKIRVGYLDASKLAELETWSEVVAVLAKSR